MVGLHRVRGVRCPSVPQGGGGGGGVGTSEQKGCEIGGQVSLHFFGNFSRIFWFFFLECHKTFPKKTFEKKIVFPAPEPPPLPVACPAPIDIIDFLGKTAPQH